MFIMWEGFKGKLDEIAEDLAGRFRNPLILSFILVWLYKHWPIVYYFITVERRDVLIRTQWIENYISHNGVWGMVFFPLLLAFVSLAVFYLIGIAAQGIKIFIGKRLYAQLVQRWDSGQFAKKEEVARLQKINAQLKSDYKRTVAERDEINTEKAERDQTITILRKQLRDLEEVKKQYDEDKTFNRAMRRPLLTLLDKTVRNTKLDLFDKGISTEPKDVMEGEWQVKLSSKIHGASQDDSMHLKINGINIYSNADILFGTIKEFKFHYTTKLIHFVCVTRSEEVDIKVDLVRIDNNTLLGIWGTSYADFVREAESLQ